jgi:hypothetical protein
MAECYPPLHAASDRLFGDVIAGETGRIITGVGVEV